MKIDDPQISLAEEQVAAKKLQFLSTLAQARQRLSPSSLRQDASNAIMDIALDRISGAKEHARRNPGRLFATAAMLALTFARRPVAGLLDKLLGIAQAQYRKRRSRSS